MSPRARAFTLALCLFLLESASSPVLAGLVEQTILTLPSHQPAFAEQLSPNLAAFSIEMDHWPDWAGEAVGQPNAFVLQLLENLRERAGVPPSIRVGAASEDRSIIDLSYQVGNATFSPPTPNVPYPEASEVRIGQDWYALSSNFLPGTHFTWGLNLRSLNRTETLAQASLLGDTFQGSRAGAGAGAGAASPSLRNITNVTLELVEIGNEPDLYSNTAVPVVVDYTIWTPFTYSSTWSEYVKAVMGVVDFSGTTRLQTGAFAAGETWRPFNVRSVLEAGLLDDQDVRSKTTVFSQHLYSGVFAAGTSVTPGQLMGKRNVRQIVAQRGNDIVAAKKAGLTYVLGETNSYANHGAPGISNTAESAIWGVDYMLYCASLGVSRTHFHNGVGYAYNVIQPIAGVDDGTNTNTNPPRAHIMPLYHAFLVVDEAIGISGDAWVAELGTTNGTGVGSLNTVLAAYGIWEGNQSQAGGGSQGEGGEGGVKRVVLINSVPYLPGNGKGEDRYALDVYLGGKGWDVSRNATIKRLFTPTTNSSHGLTWANQSFDTNDGKPAGQVVEEPLVNGTLRTYASEVVLITFS